MKQILLSVCCFISFPAFAISPELDEAIENARLACGNISSELETLKTMAGINTAVTGVGATIGIGATAVGIAKSAQDKKAEDENSPVIASDKLTKIEINETAFKDLMLRYVENFKLELASVSKEEKKSIKMGNVRTGLMATNTATNIAGAVIAGSNRIDYDLNAKIKRCITAVDELSKARMVAHVSGTATDNQEKQSQNIITNCGEWRTVNLNNINKRSTNATVSSGVGAGVGLIGTIISAKANTQNTRQGDDNKEKNLNTAANIMAGGATVASGVATIFNASQISAIKHAVEIADKCEGVL